MDQSRPLSKTPLDKFKQRALRFFHGKSHSMDSPRVLPSRKTELLAEQVTNSEFPEPSAALLSALAKLSETENDWLRIKGVMNQRLSMGIQGHGKNWIYLYKVVVLIEYLLKHVPLYLIDEISNSFLDALILLCSFYYVDGSKVDRGLKIRNKARMVLYLLQNPATLLKERSKIEGTHFRDELENQSLMMFEGEVSCLSLPSPSNRGISVNQMYYSEPHSPTYADWDTSYNTSRMVDDMVSIEPPNFSKSHSEWEECTLGESCDNQMSFGTDRFSDAFGVEHSLRSTHLSPMQLPASFVRVAESWRSEHAADSNRMQKKCGSQFSMASREPSDIQLSSASAPQSNFEFHCVS